MELNRNVLLWSKKTNEAVSVLDTEQIMSLITEDLFCDWIIDDNPRLAVKLLKMGVRQFGHE